MNIEFDAYKVKLNDVKPALDGLAGSLNGTPAPKWDWYAIEEPWTKVSNTYTGQPEGDCIEVAKRVYTTIWH